MPGSKTTSFWKAEPLGLAMIGASLAVILLIAGLLAVYDRQSREADVRSRATDLIQTLSLMPRANGLSDEDLTRTLQVLRPALTGLGMAYVQIVDDMGEPFSGIATQGIVAPAGAAPNGSGTSERLLTVNGATVLEFQAPLRSRNNLDGYIRLGYFRPDYQLGYARLPLLASLALPIFLLVPVFYGLVKRKIKPLRHMSEQIDELAEHENASSTEAESTSEPGEFVHRFNNFIALTRHRIDNLETEQSRLLTSAKLLSFKRARVQAVLQAVPDAVLVLDQSGTVSFANSKLGAMIGTSSDHVMGKKPSQWCQHPELLAYLSTYEGRQSASLSHQRVVFSPEKTSNKVVAAQGYPLFSTTDSETMFGTLVVFRDITAEELAKQSRGDFVSHIAHELKSPLSVLALYSEALQGEDGDTREFRVEATNIIHDEVERLASLIDNLLSITKIEQGSLSLDRQRVKFRELLEDTFETITRTARDKQIEFQLNLPKELTPITADKDLLRIAINNLLTNAVKYSDPGGRVALSAEETEESMIIRVRDNGIGIAPKNQKNIFQKFFRVDDEEVQQRTGHGLGLPLALEITKLHHGQLDVTSSPGKGTEFTLELAKEVNFIRQAV